jgi:hypothetical protein
MPSERNRNRRVKASLLTLLFIGILGVLVEQTMANFTAQTTNASNTFSSGTLVLSNAKTSGTTCLSTGGGATDTNNNSVGCDNLINATVQKPGAAATTDVVTIKNVGSITPTIYKLWSTSCSSANNAEAYHGTGDLCTATNLTIHDDTNNYCYYPVAGAGACTMTSGKNLSTFAAAYPTEPGALVLSLTGLGAGIQYSISTQMDAGAGNNMQGRVATIDFNWKVLQ